MASTKSRKVSFYNFFMRHKDDAEDIRPASLIKELVDYVLDLENIARIFPKENAYKTWYISSADYKEEIEVISGVEETVGYHKVCFKSATHGYRAPLMHRKTGEERDNPKHIEEGECQKTHLVIKYHPHEVLVTLERNGNGVSIDQIINYFKAFLKLKYKEQGKKLNHILLYHILAKENFLEEVTALERVVTAQVYVDKKILGSAALDFSNRIETMQHDVILNLKAVKERSLAQATIDIFRKLGSSNSQIKRIRIEGKNKYNNTVTIDTSFIEKIEHVDAELNTNTGEVNTTRMLSDLHALVREL